MDDVWKKIAIDLEIIQTEGFSATKQVDPNMVIKKKNNVEQEVQDGWVGHVIPFELVQETMLSKDFCVLRAKDGRLNEITSEYESLIEKLSEDEQQKLLNDDNTKFVSKEISAELELIMNDSSTPEIQVLKKYLSLSRNHEKIAFCNAHSEVDWSAMVPGKNGIYGKREVNQYIEQLKSNIRFKEDSYEDVILKTYNLISEEKDLKKSVKDDREKLHLLTKKTIEELTDAQVLDLLRLKWVAPLVNSLAGLSNAVISDFIAKLIALSKKYETTFAEVDHQISETESSLANLLGELTGNEFDIQGINELKKLLEGE